MTKPQMMKGISSILIGVFVPTYSQTLLFFLFFFSFLFRLHYPCTHGNLIRPKYCSKCRSVIPIIMEYLLYKFRPLEVFKESQSCKYKVCEF